MAKYYICKVTSKAIVKLEGFNTYDAANDVLEAWCNAYPDDYVDILTKLEANATPAISAMVIG
jgi:hypothetical protein